MDDIDKAKAALEALGYKDMTPKRADALEGYVVLLTLHMGRSLNPTNAYVSGLAFVTDMQYADVYPTKEEAEASRLEVVERATFAMQAGAMFASPEHIFVVPFIPELN